MVPSKPLRVLKHPGTLKITRPSILKNAKEVNWSYSDSLEQTTKFCLDFDRIEKSWNDFKLHIKKLNLDTSNCTGDYVICDFVAPLPEMRINFNADWVIWVDTIDSSIYTDTNNMFISPDKYDFRVTEKNSSKWASIIGSHILSIRQ